MEPFDYKQAYYRIKHRHYKFVLELRMEMYLHYIDQFCEAEKVVILMHRSTKSI